MESFWRGVDRLWLQLASVKLTLVVLVSLLLLSIPGTLILQVNISNVDPGMQYDYDFWKLGKTLQLFTAYHSSWYVGLMVLLSLNLIACSVERWPQMWKLASAKPVAWARATFENQPKNFQLEWKENLTKEAALKTYLDRVKLGGGNPKVVEDGPENFQIFFQKGQWSRIANYLVHTSLLVIFGGAIISALYGFEGAANIPAGAAVDTFLIFSEGRMSGLKPAPGGLVNEKLLGFRLQAEEFKVDFYEKFPGRPKDFVSKLNVIRNSKVLASDTIRVNDPMSFEKYVFYQASYGRLGDFDVKFRYLPKDQIGYEPKFGRGQLGETLNFDHKGRQATTLVAVSAQLQIQNLGPGVLFQELVDGKASGKPFWVLQNYPEFDFARESHFGIIVDDVKELLFTGLQIGYDPGAPIYWLGCFGMLLGTFYALFVTHRKFQLRYDRGQVNFAGTIHRMPSGFENQVKVWAHKIRGRKEEHGQS